MPASPTAAPGVQSNAPLNPAMVPNNNVQNPRDLHNVLQSVQDKVKSAQGLLRTVATLAIGSAGTLHALKYNLVLPASLTQATSTLGPATLNTVRYHFLVPATTTLATATTWVTGIAAVFFLLFLIAYCLPDSQNNNPRTA